jgi:uncharacterized protein with von Willebrand factor type A (vWA) domain
MQFEYTRWDGTQEGFPFDADELMEALSDDLIADGDLRNALHRMLQWGHEGQDGQRMKGIQDLMDQLRARRQEELSRYDLGTIVDQIQEKLEKIVQMERSGIDRRLDQASQGVPPEHFGQKPEQLNNDSSSASETGEASPGGDPQMGDDATGGAQADAQAKGQGADSGANQSRSPSPGQQSSQSGDSSQSGTRGSSQSLAGDQAGEGQTSGGQQSSSPGDLDPAAMQKLLERIANRKREFLDNLPKDLGGAIRGLSDYEFMDNDARQEFQDLLKMLQQKMLQQQFQGMQQAIQNLTPEDMQKMRQMVQDLNQMLQEKAQGGNPDFNSFMQKHGQFFPGVKSLEELVEQMQRRMAQMRSLLDSMTPEMRKSLQGMFESLLRDDRMRWDLAKLAATLEQLMPSRQFRGRYPFSGDEPVTLDEAMRLMEKLQNLDQLEKQLRRARDGQSLSQLDSAEVESLLGEEAAKTLDQLQQLTKILEDAGYITRTGNTFELTPRGVRKIGQKALSDIFTQLRRDRPGKHETHHRGTAGDRSDESKRYEFGDPFLLDLQKTIMNAVHRTGAGSPVSLAPADFEVYRTEHLTQVSTVLMLDMSRSMLLRGCYLAAKKVAMALNSLIRGQFPKDNLYLIGFSDYARELKPELLPQLDYNEYVYGTNLQHGLMMARRMLARHKTGNRQIIVITDGEPTAHFEDGRVHFSYPPTAQTIRETLKEVVHCTREQIVINTFMLERSHYLTEFVNQMTRINKGRAFFASPERLGEYILVDYVNNKRKRIA